MARERKLDTPVTLFAAIEASQHEALRLIAFQERRSMADITRQAVERYIKSYSKKKAIPGLEMIHIRESQSVKVKTAKSGGTKKARA